MMHTEIHTHPFTDMQVIHAELLNSLSTAYFMGCCQPFFCFIRKDIIKILNFCNTNFENNHTAFYSLPWKCLCNCLALALLNKIFPSTVMTMCVIYVWHQQMTGESKVIVTHGLLQVLSFDVKCFMSQMRHQRKHIPLFHASVKEMYIITSWISTNNNKWKLVWIVANMFHDPHLAWLWINALLELMRRMLYHHNHPLFLITIIMYISFHTSQELRTSWVSLLFSCGYFYTNPQGPLLLTWNNLIPSMDT